MIQARNLDLTNLKPEFRKNLFSGTAASSVTLSENASNYDSIVIMVQDPGYDDIGSIEIKTDKVGGVAFSCSSGGYLRIAIAKVEISGNTVWLSQRFIISFSGNNASPNIRYDASGAKIIRVDGIIKNS